MVFLTASGRCYPFYMLEAKTPLRARANALDCVKGAGGRDDQPGPAGPDRMEGEGRRSIAANRPQHLARRIDGVIRQNPLPGRITRRSFESVAFQQGDN